MELFHIFALDTLVYLTVTVLIVITEEFDSMWKNYCFKLVRKTLFNKYPM